jgi:hypothetical protein
VDERHTGVDPSRVAAVSESDIEAPVETERDELQPLKRLMYVDLEAERLLGTNLPSQGGLCVWLTVKEAQALGTFLRSRLRVST